MLPLTARSWSRQCAASTTSWSAPSTTSGPCSKPSDYAPSRFASATRATTRCSPPTGTRAAQLREKLDIPADRRVLLYAPTFRNTHRRVRSRIRPRRVRPPLRRPGSPPVRAHYLNSVQVPQEAGDAIRDVSTYPDVTELMLASDGLLTDYSSVMFDYALLDRPLLFFAPDATTYAHDRGTYFDLAQRAPGPFTTTQDELFTAIAAFAAQDGAPRSLLRCSQALRARIRRIRDRHRRRSGRRAVLRRQRRRAMTDVFIVCNTIHELGGVQRWAHRVGELLAERGHNVHLIGVFAVRQPHELTTTGPDGERFEPVYQASVIHPDLYGGKPKPALLSRIANPLAYARYKRWQAVQRSGAARLRALIAAASDPADAVVIGAQVHAMEWVAQATPRGVPIIAMSHESYAAANASSRGRRVRKLYRTAARFVSLTDADAHEWTRAGMNNAAAIPNPLPIPALGGADPAARVVVAAGRLSQEKGFDLLLDAWHDAVLTRPGLGPCASTARAQIKRAFSNRHGPSVSTPASTSPARPAISRPRSSRARFSRAARAPKASPCRCSKRWLARCPVSPSTAPRCPRTRPRRRERTAGATRQHRSPRRCPRPPHGRRGGARDDG